VVGRGFKKTVLQPVVVPLAFYSFGVEYLSNFHGFAFALKSRNKPVKV